MLQIQQYQKRIPDRDAGTESARRCVLKFARQRVCRYFRAERFRKDDASEYHGGLDRYDSGDLIINGISTKKYKDRDWDSYRNHTIGFVFQSYNLIPHQTILANVELALTISGCFQRGARKKAIAALEKDRSWKTAPQAAEPDVRRSDAACRHRPRSCQ